MIAEAALGIAGGALIAAALAGFRRVRNWERAARLIAIIVAGLALLAAASLIVIRPAALASQVVLAATAVIAGGTIQSLRVAASPVALGAGGALLMYVTLAGKSDAAAPLTFVDSIAVLTSSLTLPAIDVSAREWRKAPDHFEAVVALWIGISIALAVGVLTNLIQRGTWLGSTPEAAWSMAAWAASSGSLLARRGRPRAALIFTAALAVALGALSS